MSTRISERLLLPAILAVAGCVGGIGGIGDDADTGTRRVQVTADMITIAGPRGYCVDPTATRDDGDTGFVLLGNCAAISGNARAPQPDLSAVLTAAVSARSDGASLTGNLGALDGFFRSEAGRGLLSRSGDPSSVQILESRVSGEMFLLHARDTGPGALPGVAQDYWRAYLDVGPRLATLTVLALADLEISDDQALAVLNRFAATVRTGNSGAAAAANAADLPQAAGEAGGGLFRAGLFQRIFR